MTASFGPGPNSSERIVAGIGFASAATAGEIIGLIGACLGLSPDQLAALGTHARKSSSPIPAQVALHFGVPLRLLADEDLPPGVPGIAEAVASAAGPLRLDKRKSRYATCAIASCSEAFGQPSSPRAVMASSTVATSSAGP